MTTEMGGKRITVAGLGRFGGGISVARWLAAQGASVLVVDRDPPEKLAASIEQLKGLPIEFRLGEEPQDAFTQTDLVVASPALKPDHPGLAAARNVGVSVTTEISLFLQRCPARVLGVTGTKGKSTTAALLHRMLCARFTTHLGGNIGVSLLESLPRIAAEHLVVLELSSFMLHWLGREGWSPHGAILTMIDLDHLDWHGSMAAYHEAKSQLVAHQTPADFVVVDATHPASLAIARRSAADVTEVPAALPQRLALRLPGEHNQRNAQLALHAATRMGVSFEDAQQAVRDFPGLPHRLELVYEASGVRWFNDSIATIPQAAVVANAAFDDGRVIQIIGGHDKGLDMSDMCATLAQRCKAVLTIGALGPVLAGKCQNTKPRAEVFTCETLDVAVTRAREIAASGDVVLLSTGCASYGQFLNFEERGKRFAELARGGAT